MPITTAEYLQYEVASVTIDLLEKTMEVSVYIGVTRGGNFIRLGNVLTVNIPTEATVGIITATANGTKSVGVNFLRGIYQYLITSNVASGIIDS